MSSSDNHPFAPTAPGSTSCKWCSFHENAHTTVAQGHDHPGAPPATSRAETPYKRVSNVDAGSTWEVGDKAELRRDSDGQIRIYNTTRQEFTMAGDEAEQLAGGGRLETTIGELWTAKPQYKSRVMGPFPTDRQEEDKGTDLSTWVDPAMYEAAEMSEDAKLRPRVTLLSATPDPLGAVAAMCKMYEGEVIYDLNAITDDERHHYWDQVKATHLKAPLEAIDLHFMIEGVTRAFTHQMVRQRTAVFAQESMRFAVKDEIAARPGPIISNHPGLRSTWEGAVEKVWDAYNDLINNGVPAEEARGLLPHDTLTRLHYKTNLRNLADHLGNRLCTQAQFEWRLVAAEIRRAIREHRGPVTGNAGAFHNTYYNDWQFAHIADSDMFQPVCFTVGKCPFKADFDRGCTIRERVDAGAFDEIKPAEWLADPTAGWVR